MGIKTKRFFQVTWAFLLAAIEVGCKSGPLPSFPIFNDASDAAMVGDSDPGVSACQHLRALGCPLGDAGTCPQVFDLPSKFAADPACVLAATSLADLASKCNVTCQP
jgi:hypothetical protein